MNIYQKLQCCRCELQAAKLKKSGKNSYAGFEYFELADFLPTVNELFKKYNLCSNFSINEDAAILRIIDAEKEGADNIIYFTSPIADANVKGCTPIQSLGAVHTYLKRYLYMNALEIVEGDALDPQVGKMEVEEKPKMSEAQANIINALSEQDKQLIISRCGTLDLTVEQASKWIAYFKGKKEKANGTN